MSLASAAWSSPVLCEVIFLSQNTVKLLINASVHSVGLARRVPAFAGLGVKVIILIHLTRLQASSSKQERLYYS